MDYIRAAAGLLFIIGLAYLFSGNRRAVDWRLVLTGVILQLVFGLIIAKVDLAQDVFGYVSQKFVRFLGFAQKGGEFLFCDLAKNSAGHPEVRHGLAFLFVFQTLPTVVFFSAGCSRSLSMIGFSNYVLSSVL